MNERGGAMGRTKDGGAAQAQALDRAASFAASLGVPPPSPSTPCPHNCSPSHKRGRCLCGYKKERA